MKTGKMPLWGMIGLCAFACCAIIGLAAFFFWPKQNTYFQSITVGYGDGPLTAEAFLADGVPGGEMALLTPGIDCQVLGEQEVTLRYGDCKETVVLNVVDKTPPKVSFRDCTVCVTEIPEPEAFVESVEDISDVRIFFADGAPTPGNSLHKTVRIVVEDSYGNRTVGNSTLVYRWLRDSVTVELGQPLEAADLLPGYPLGARFLTQSVLDAVNSDMAPEYVLRITDGGREYTCTVLKTDTTAPSLEVQNIDHRQGRPLAASDFVVSAADLSGAVTVSFLQEPDQSELGEKKVTICATDAAGNTAFAEAVVRITGDETPPAFRGLDGITAQKGQVIDYLTGVSATDDEDGAVSFTYDASAVNSAVAGVYYVNYHAQDTSGNRRIQKRKVEILHDQADTDALVASLAASLPADAEEIRDYVRTQIGYNGDWGGDDPVWAGLMGRWGNCYVHALCFQRLLDAKGFETRLIWTTDQTHYWVLVKLEGAWKHMDATPSIPNSHSKYSIMNDTQRLETLLYSSHLRDWDRTRWPICE